MGYGVVAVCLLCAGCSLRFSNSLGVCDRKYSEIYLPAVLDLSARGGQSSRLSAAIRRRVALDTRFRLVPMEKASIGVDVRILESARIPVKTIDCDRYSDPIIAGGAYKCAQLENNFYQATVSSETETVVLTVTARIVELPGGTTLRHIELRNVSSGEFAVLSSDAAVSAGLAVVPPLHALRFAENVDNAYAAAGKIVADRIHEALTGGK